MSTSNSTSSWIASTIPTCLFYILLVTVMLQQEYFEVILRELRTRYNILLLIVRNIIVYEKILMQSVVGLDKGSVESMKAII